jgi:hypothetical protein
MRHGLSGQRMLGQIGRCTPMRDNQRPDCHHQYIVVIILLRP